LPKFKGKQTLLTTVINGIDNNKFRHTFQQSLKNVLKLNEAEKMQMANHTFQEDGTEAKLNNARQMIKMKVSEKFSSS